MSAVARQNQPSFAHTSATAPRSASQSTRSKLDCSGASAIDGTSSMALLQRALHAHVTKHPNAARYPAGGFLKAVILVRFGFTNGPGPLRLSVLLPRDGWAQVRKSRSPLN